MPARVRFTVAADGDASPASLAALAPAPPSWLRQVHGSGVVVVGDDVVGGVEGDALVTDRPDRPLLVRVADCAPLALVDGDQRVVAAVHAGWRGLAAGVVAAAADAMRDLGSTRLDAVLGPCIHPGCYEFGADDLEALVARFGPSVRGRTEDGRAALDLPAAVGAACLEAGVELAAWVDACTACTPGLFSWRARRDLDRQAVLVWTTKP